MLFDLLMGTSLVKYGVGRLGSQVAGLLGNLAKRVIVPSGLDARLRNLKGSELSTVGLDIVEAAVCSGISLLWEILEMCE